MISAEFLSVQDCNRLNFDHHFRTRELFDADQRARRIAALFENLPAELRETGAVFHVSDKHGHCDDILQRPSSSFESPADSLESDPDLSVKITRISFPRFVLKSPVARKVDHRSTLSFHRRRISAFLLSLVSCQIFSLRHAHPLLFAPYYSNASSLSTADMRTGDPRPREQANQLRFARPGGL